MAGRPAVGRETDGQSHNPQQIDLVVVSANAPPAIGPELTATEKLAGIQAMHFGAFYLSSWRQNDWIWGRLDGGYALVKLLMNPEWLLAGSQTARAAAERLSQLFGPGESVAKDALVRRASDLLENVDRSPGDQAALKEAHEFLTAAVAEQAASAILPEELKALRLRIKCDIAEGASQTTADIEFLQSPELSAAPTVKEISDAWAVCQIGRERLAGQVASDRFGELATQLAGVGVSMVGDASVGVAGRNVSPLKAVARIIKPTLRFANFLTTPGASSRPGTYFAGSAALTGTLLALLCAMRVGNIAYGTIAVAIWIGVVIAGLVHGHLGRTIGALVLLAATVGSGLASYHWKRPSLVVLGAAFAALAAFMAAFAVHKDRAAPDPSLVMAGNAAGTSSKKRP